MSKVDLKLDWCSYRAAKFAVEHWHYSRSMPSARNAFIGVWENTSFIGCVIFGIGSGFSTDGTKYGLQRSYQMAELTRVALTSHQSPVSRMVAIAIRMIQKQSPGLRLLISFADPEHDHIGGIYQASNWIYTGQTKSDKLYLSRGEYVHHRTASSRAVSIAGAPSKPLLPKHRYLYPLDDAMRKQILPLAKPYPKRAASADGGTSGVQPEGSGSSPTAALSEVQ